MAITNEKSTQVTNMDASPSKALSSRYGAGVKMLPFDFTQGAAAGDIASTVDLVKVPANCTVFKTLSRIVTSAFGAARTLDIGHAAYTKENGTAVTAGVDVLSDAVSVATAGEITLGSGTNAAGDNTINLDNNGLVLIQALLAGGTIPAGATLKGFIAYSIN